LLSQNLTDEICTSFVSLEPCGHQLLFTFTEFHLRFLFALHGQIVPCSFTVFEQIKSKTYSFQPTTAIKEISWQCALVFPNTSSQRVVLLFADHNRINSCYFLLRSWHSSPRDPNRNCDPQANWLAYQTQIRQSFTRLAKLSGKSIFEIILQDNACFNGFGLNLATEALHQARIHPMWSSQMVFQQPHLRERLLQGLKDIATREDLAWKKYVPRYFNLDDPFHYNKRAIEFYQEHINQVYDKQYCLVRTEICSTLHKEGLLVCYPSCYLSCRFFINRSFPNPTEKALLKKSCVVVYLSTKFGESTNLRVILLVENLASTPLLLWTSFPKLKILNITYIKGMPHL
jgi:hypothetical protein